jgi:hypothetical protein
MVESLIIRDKYIQLLELIKIEADLNTSIKDYYNYLNEYKNNFCDESNLICKQDLKEFLRGANRYSDEFIFSDKYYSEIREITNTLYDVLNAESPI